MWWKRIERTCWRPLVTQSVNVLISPGLNAHGQHSAAQHHFTARSNTYGLMYGCSNTRQPPPNMANSDGSEDTLRRRRHGCHQSCERVKNVCNKLCNRFTNGTLRVRIQTRKTQWWRRHYSLTATATNVKFNKLAGKSPSISTKKMQSHLPEISVTCC